MQRLVNRGAAGLARDGLKRGDRVAILMGNRFEWAAFDMAALTLGLVIVPLYLNNRPENAAHILNDSGARLLFVESTDAWDDLAPIHGKLDALERVVTLNAPAGPSHDRRLVSLMSWLPRGRVATVVPRCREEDLATIIYTSGTTGKPKGVMLTHKNILSDAFSSLELVPAYRGDIFLSFLPLSHALERTAGLYLPMMAGAEVAFSRGVGQLKEDLRIVRPTALISAPRIYERFYQAIQARLKEASPLRKRLFDWTLRLGWEQFLRVQGKQPWAFHDLFWPVLDFLIARKVRERLGGRLRVAISGGAPLAAKISRFFLALGVPVVQGYGLTESAPVVAVNALEDNDPASVGLLLPGLEAKIGDEGELLVRGPEVMRGYWNNPEATDRVIDAEGWLHTGDQAEVRGGRVFITGRLKEIIVLANGRKAAPGELEGALTLDPLFSQALVVGEGAPYLTALVVLDPERWRRVARELSLHPDVTGSLASPRLEAWILKRIERLFSAFPAYARIRRVSLSLEPWTVENGLITPTLKVKREKVQKAFAPEIFQMYEGHHI